MYDRSAYFKKLKSELRNKLAGVSKGDGSQFYKQ